MPPWTVSYDLKLRIPVLRHVQGYSVKKICEALGIRKSLVYRTLQLYDSLADVTNTNPRKAGRRRRLDFEDINYIKSRCHLHSSVFLDELQSDLLSCRNVKISLSTLFRTLRRLGITRKKVSRHALERNEEKRAAFMNRLADIAPDPEMLMFGDEAAKNKHTLARQMGYSARGTRCVQSRCFVRGTRWSILPILTLDGIITHDIMHGSVTSKRFIQFLRELVVPLMNPYPGPQSVLVLDNCRIHHTDEIRELIEEEAQGCLVFLPPYSPDYNPIEEAFSTIKAFLRRHSADNTLATIDEACHNITPDKARGYFRSSGYIL